MFDIGWTELIVVAVVMILVVGPKDLPRMLRTFGQTVGKVRRMAGEFQSTFNDALREAEQQADIADMKAQVEKAANFDPLGDLKKSIEADAPKKASAANAPKPGNGNETASGKTETPAASSASSSGPADDGSASPDSAPADAETRAPAPKAASDGTV